MHVTVHCSTVCACTALTAQRNASAAHELMLCFMLDDVAHRENRQRLASAHSSTTVPFRHSLHKHHPAATTGHSSLSTTAAVAAMATLHRHYILRVIVFYCARCSWCEPHSACTAVVQALYWSSLLTALRLHVLTQVPHGAFNSGSQHPPQQQQHQQQYNSSMPQQPWGPWLQSQQQQQQQQPAQVVHCVPCGPGASSKSKNNNSSSLSPQQLGSSVALAVLSSGTGALATAALTAAGQQQQQQLAAAAAAACSSSSSTATSSSVVTQHHGVLMSQ
eukprot:8589-Heterococcus_DN1.PRE.1